MPDLTEITFTLKDINKSRFIIDPLEVKEEGRYGWGRFSPDFIQCFNSPKWSTAFFCLGTLVQGSTVSGLLQYYLPTIEQQFQFSSMQSGLLLGAYNIAVMLSVVPTTYFGGVRGSRRPRYIGCGLLILGLGSLIFTIPALFCSPIRHIRKELCVPVATSAPKESGGNSSLPFWILVIGNFLHGIGSSPLYTLVVTYIDDNVPVKQASLYIGCYYLMAVVGPFLGNVVAGLFAQVNGEIMWSEEISATEHSPESPAWIGCWWCGFFINGIFACLFSIPIFGLPKLIPGGNNFIKERESLRDDGLKRNGYTTISQLPQAILELLKCPLFLFVTAASCAELFIFTGVGGFTSKLLKVFFGLSSTDLAIYLSVITIPSILGGIYFGATMVKLCHMSVKQILIMDLIVLICSLPCGFGVLISCHNEDIIGISTAYSSHSSASTSRISEKVNLISDCNKNCHCNEGAFSPVCGSDGKEYYSACYAGCRKVEKLKDLKVFEDCECIPKNYFDKPDAVDGFCSIPCPLFPLFVFLMFAYLFFSFSCLVPTITATLRNLTFLIQMFKLVSIICFLFAIYTAYKTTKKSIQERPSDC